jgi:hypothetical protein
MPLGPPIVYMRIRRGRPWARHLVRLARPHAHVRFRRWRLLVRDVRRERERRDPAVAARGRARPAAGGTVAERRREVLDVEEDAVALCAQISAQRAQHRPPPLTQKLNTARSHLQGASISAGHTHASRNAPVKHADVAVHVFGQRIQARLHAEDDCAGASAAAPGRGAGWRLTEHQRERPRAVPGEERDERRAAPAAAQAADELGGREHEQRQLEEQGRGPGACERGTAGTAADQAHTRR